MSPEDRLDRKILFGIAVAIAAPLVLFDYPPMTDFPHHEALVALLRRFQDSTLYPPIYERNLGQPNQLFHLLAWPLATIVPVTLACKIVAALSVASVIAGGARLARHVNAPPLAAACLVPIAIGWLFYWGFVSNLMGIGILLAALPTADGFAKRPTVREGLLASVFMLLLYLAHELMMLVYVGAVSCFGLLWTPTALGLGVRALPAAFGMVVALVQIRLQEPLKTGTVRVVANYWPSVDAKLREVPAILLGVVEPVERTLILLLLVALIAGLVLLVRTTKPAPPTAPSEEATPSPEPLWLRLRSRRFLVLAAAVFGLYLVAPLTFNGAMLVHQRFLAPAFALLVFGLTARTTESKEAPNKAKLELLGRVLAVALPLGCLATQLAHYGDASRNYNSMRELFSSIEPKSSVAGIDLDLAQGGRPFTFASGLSRVLTERGGRVLYSFTESTVAPVITKRNLLWNEPSVRVMFNPSKFRPAWDLTRFRYLLVHASTPRELTATAIAVRGEANLIGVSGEWALLRSKLDVVAPDAPDAPLPTPHPESLGKRLAQLERQMGELQGGTPLEAASASPPP